MTHVECLYPSGQGQWRVRPWSHDRGPFLLLEVSHCRVRLLVAKSRVSGSHLSGRSEIEWGHSWDGRTDICGVEDRAGPWLKRQGPRCRNSHPGFTPNTSDSKCAGFSGRQQAVLQIPGCQLGVLHFSSVRTLTPWSFESVPPHIKGSVPQDCRTVDSSWKPGPLKGSWSPSSCSPICWGGSQGSDALLLLSLVCSKGHSSEEPCGQRDVEGGRGPPRPLWLCHLPAPQNPR